jgi:hypothetical protein
MVPSAEEPTVTHPPLVPAIPMRAAEHLSISEARDLLDWLEGQGIRAHEVSIESDGKMTVRWPE